mgnify:FL=1
MDSTLVEPTPYTAHVREGRIAHEIVNFAEKQGSSLIVLATHGLSGLDHFLIGSNSERVAMLAHEPVFILVTRNVVQHGQVDRPAKAS